MPKAIACKLRGITEQESSEMIAGHLRAQEADKSSTQMLAKEAKQEQRQIQATSKPDHEQQTEIPIASNKTIIQPMKQQTKQTKKQTEKQGKQTSNSGRKKYCK